jgi:hypothetical protein
VKKIPTLFKRDPLTHRVVDERVPETEWVGDRAVRQIATRKYDGTCMMLDDNGVWWHRREVKAGTAWPEGFELADEDTITGKVVGWMPAHTSSIARYWEDAVVAEEIEGRAFKLNATYELCGPKINKNPEGFEDHVLVQHGQHMVFDVPTDYEGLKAYLEYSPGEGFVWWAEDGRMVKIKKRDFGWRR